MYWTGWYNHSPPPQIGGRPWGDASRLRSARGILLLPVSESPSGKLARPPPEDLLNICRRDPSSQLHATIALQLRSLITVLATVRDT